MRIATFLVALKEAISGMKVCVFASVNKELKEIIDDLFLGCNNFVLTELLQQLTILPTVDAFITHGGLGSIKEAIYFKVPMLVFPLDYSWDQYSNGMSVAQNGIGELGDIDRDEIEEIRIKVCSVIYNGSYANNIAKLADDMFSRYDSDFDEFVFQVITKN